MTPRARGWTVVALIAAVAILMVSVSWALQWSNLGQSEQHRFGIERHGTATGIESAVVELAAFEMHGHSMMGRAGGWPGNMMLRHAMRVDAPFAAGIEFDTTGWLRMEPAPGQHADTCHFGD